MSFTAIYYVVTVIGIILVVIAVTKLVQMKRHDKRHDKRPSYDSARRIRLLRLFALLGVGWTFTIFVGGTLLRGAYLSGSNDVVSMIIGLIAGVGLAMAMSCVGQSYFIKKGYV